MNKLFSFLIFLLFITNSNAQACGIYSVKIVGIINSKKVKFEKIKIPKVRILEYQVKSKINEHDFLEFKIDDNKINIETQSSMGSIYQDVESLKEVYKRKSSKLPLILYKNKTEIKIEIDWDRIEITEIKSKDFGNYFEINLKEINIETE